MRRSDRRTRSAIAVIAAVVAVLAVVAPAAAGAPQAGDDRLARHVQPGRPELRRLRGHRAPRPARVVCPEGTFVDTFIRFAGFQSDRGVVQLQVGKTFTCDDGSGSFFVKLQIQANFDTGIETFTWVANGGTGDYAGLRGSGRGTTVPNAPIGNINTYEGFLLR